MLRHLGPWLLAASPLAGQEPARLEVRLPRLSDTDGPGGHVLSSFGADSFEALARAHRQGSINRWPAVPLPGGRSVELELRPVEIWEPGASARVVRSDGSETRLAPTIRLFAVHVPGHPSRGFLGTTRSMLHGYLSLDGEGFVLSTGPDRGMPGPLAITHARGFPGLGSERSCLSSEAISPPAPVARSAGSPDLHETRVFLEVDHSLRARFRSDQSALDYATLLVAATSEIFRRDVGATLVLPSGFVRIWNAPAPWGELSELGQISKIRSFWNSDVNALRDLERAQVHVLGAPVIGGVAQGVGLLCNDSWSYALSTCNGSFPHPLRHLSGSNWDLLVFAHESGHLYGSQHTFDYSPPIECDDGSGPDGGTLMGYCHRPDGVQVVGMRFHPRVQDALRDTIAAGSCVRVIPIAPGDYDANGLIDSRDLSALDAYLGQGFSSRGALETFDLDGDGRVDWSDRDALAHMALPPATTQAFNGSGANCATCYTAAGRPVLGSTWTAYVGGFSGAPVRTTILGFTDALATPRRTRFGEVLIGGTQLFAHDATTNGQFALHAITLPANAALAGLRVPTQAILFVPGRARLVNGIALELSTY